MALARLRSSAARSIPRNYRDLCGSTFQGEFVSQPPAEIRSVFNSSDSRGGGGGERARQARRGRSEFFPTADTSDHTRRPRTPTERDVATAPRQAAVATASVAAV